MEPPVAVADFSEDSVEVWAPVQDPRRPVGRLPLTWACRHKIHIHPTMLGGAFGRKSNPTSSWRLWSYLVEEVFLYECNGHANATRYDISMLLAHNISKQRSIMMVR